jgi:hypothetical protein
LGWGLPWAGKVVDDFSFGKKQLEPLMLEDLLQIFELEWGRNSEHGLFAKTVVCAENVAVRIKPQEIPKGLDGNHGDCDSRY